MLSTENSTLNANAVAWMPTQQVWGLKDTWAQFESLRVLYSQDYSETESENDNDDDSENDNDDDSYNDSDIGNDYENEPRPDYDEINYRIWEDENETLDQDQDQDQEDQMEEDPYYASIDALLEETAQIDVFMETRREDIWLLNYLRDTRDSDMSVTIDPSDYETCWV